MSKRFGWLILLGLLLGCDQGRQLMVKGNQAYLRGDQSAAAALYEQASQHHNIRSSALLNWGRVLLEKGQFEAALEKLHQGLQDQPANALGRYYRAQTQLALGKPEKAEADLKIALQANPTLGEAWLLQAKTQYARAAEEAAFASLEEALRDPAVRESASLLKAKWALAKEDRALAQVALETLLMWRPYSEPAHRQLAQLLLDGGDSVGAEGHYRALIRIGGPALSERLILADLLLDRGKLAEAVGLYAGVAEGDDPELAARATAVLEELNDPSGRVVVNTEPLAKPGDEQSLASHLAQLVGSAQELELQRMSRPSGWDGGYFMARMSMVYYVTSGTLVLESRAGTHEVGVGQSALVPKGTPVGIRNGGESPVEYLWVSVPSFSPELVIRLKRLP